MLCYFCEDNHDSWNFCSDRRQALLDRIWSVSHEKPVARKLFFRQTKIPEAFSRSRPVSHKEKSLDVTTPIIISDDEDDLFLTPVLSDRPLFQHEQEQLSPPTVDTQPTVAETAAPSSFCSPDHVSARVKTEFFDSFSPDTPTQLTYTFPIPNQSYMTSDKHMTSPHVQLHSMDTVRTLSPTATHKPTMRQAMPTLSPLPSGYSDTPEPLPSKRLRRPNPKYFSTPPQPKSELPLQITPPGSPAAEIQEPHNSPANRLSSPDDTVFRQEWACIDKTINNKVLQSKLNTRKSLRRFLLHKLHLMDPKEVAQEQWLKWLIQWAIPRGKCVYRDKSTGISPQSARIYYNMFKYILLETFHLHIEQHFPEITQFPTKWQETITRDKHYVRKQAGYFSKNDVREYLQMFEEYIKTGIIFFIFWLYKKLPIYLKQLLVITGFSWFFSNGQNLTRK